ncbi:MAG: ABC transporter substrate-binding protein [Planctomycetota bacterium]
MQNRFGVKDFFLFLVVAVVGVLVYLQLRQADLQRRDVLQPLKSQIDEMSEALGRLQRDQARINATIDRISREVGELGERGIVVAPGGGVGVTPPRSSGGGDAWAVEGVPIKRPPFYDFTHDPREQTDFVEGGELRFVLRSPPDKLTYYLAGDVTAREVNSFIFQSLGRLHHDTLEEVSVLAEAWQVAPDGLWMRARIRDEARWADGEPVTAEDFAWTFSDVMKNELIDAARSRSIYDNMIEVVALADKVVEFRFAEPIYSNESLAYGFAPLPKHYYIQFAPEAYNSSTALQMGSGPFRPVSFDPADQWAAGAGDIVLVRNNNYWASPPAYNGVRFSFLNTAAAMLQAFENGEGDLIGATPEQFSQKIGDEQFLDMANIHQWVNIQSSYSFIGWNTGPRPDGSLGPFHDIRVRQAMTMLIDRERIIRDFFEGLGEIAYGPNPPGPASSPTVEPWPYDPDRAAELLTEAGWIDRDDDGILENEAGEEFVFTYTIVSASQTFQRIASYLTDAMRRAGIRVNVDGHEWSRFGELLRDRDFDAISLGWSASGPESDPKQIWHPDSIQDEGDNFVQWSGPKTEDGALLTAELIDAGRRTLDRDERMRIWQQLHEVIHEEQPYTFLVRNPTINFVNKRVGNFREYPLNKNKIEWFLLQ